MGDKKIRKKQNEAPQAPQEPVELTIQQNRNSQSHSNKEKSSTIRDNSSVKKAALSLTGEHKKRSKAFKETDSPATPSAQRTGSKNFFCDTAGVEERERSRIVAMDVDPYCLHVYWEVTHSDKQKILAQLDKNSPPPRQAIRIYDVTLIDFDTGNAHSHFDIEVDGSRGNWYIDLWSPHKSLCVEIGMKSSHAIFYPIARSNFIDTPGDCLSHTGEEKWMSVSGDYEEVSILPEKPRAEKNGAEDTLHHDKKAFQATDLKRPYMSPSGKEIPFKKTSSAKREHPADKNALRKQPLPAPPRSHKDTIPLKKRVTEAEIKEYYKKLQFQYRQEDKNIQSSPATNPHPKHNLPSEEGCTPRLLPDLTTHCGSDTRWEKEKLQKK